MCGTGAHNFNTMQYLYFLYRVHMVQAVLDT
jgi:hypothetical protein